MTRIEIAAGAKAVFSSIKKADVSRALSDHLEQEMMLVAGSRPDGAARARRATL